MHLNWLPWKYIIRRVARAEGFIDPVQVLGRLYNFAQPAEVDVPIELLRAGAVMHATGLINSRALQHNMDWIWPYWVERQFNPEDESFVPRAFSITVINLTHRNWTAVGVPDFHSLPVVDPRGLVMPFYRSWSLDAWIIRRNGEDLIPSRMTTATQEQLPDDNLTVETRCRLHGLDMTMQTRVEIEDGDPVCAVTCHGSSRSPAWLAVALRPYNPEGISFIHEIGVSKDRRGWNIDEDGIVRFDREPQRMVFSEYHQGDVYHHLFSERDDTEVSCRVGMATAAALFPIAPHTEEEVTVRIPLGKERDRSRIPPGRSAGDHWRACSETAAALYVPDDRFNMLYEAAVRTVILHSPDEAYAGPFTYKRFWFRDAAIIAHTLVCAGLPDRALRLVETFFERQKSSGYFESQNGEWDSNGQVLWTVGRLMSLTRGILPGKWRRSIANAADWIMDKRLPDDGDDVHAGLLPAGYSAEHLGPTDYYYWDDFWSVAGLEYASSLLGSGDPGAEKYAHAARSLRASIDRSLAAAADRIGRPAMPAAPLRRLDSGAVGSLAAGYPLYLWDGDDIRLLDTAAYLAGNCMHGGGFFHDMIHSGVNAYLTLHIAQVMLRAGNQRFFDLVGGIADIASPTGHWPEAVHPRTGGGCMGDGQHVWAASEWIMMMRNMFVYDDTRSGTLVLCAGIPLNWCRRDVEIGFGPAPTAFGTVRVALHGGSTALEVVWEADWREAPPPIEIRIPGLPVFRPSADTGRAHIPLRGEMLPDEGEK